MQDTALPERQRAYQLLILNRSQKSDKKAH